ncbi:MAG: hypothetical protein DI533_15915 [Cereibacter sphaeroides]|uniref:VWFA domain-containing protein n=1 Tax=Cereibacter sphaeroides TaxID=1063 RepID=A0A2W5U1E7_CERSP|nr:MAG: hypothetical protein DI533_15915 [Cereibacter sphaeroides]
MACLNLVNGAFSLAQFTTANANAGQLTITRTATSISVQRVGFNNLFLNGRWESLVFGGGAFVALLRFIDGAPGSAQRTIFIVDFTAGSGTPGLEQIHEQGTVQNSVSRPQIMLAPGPESLVFVWSATGFAQDLQRFAICRSDNGDVLLAGPVTLSGVNGNISAEITSTQVIMHHPNTGFSDETAGPRPTGTCKVVGGTVDFGEAVLGASNPGLATKTKSVTLRNDGTDCLTISAIANSAPFALTAASASMLPVTLSPSQTISVDVVFSPSAPNNNITANMAITRSPANGDSQISCKGKARNAEAKIAASPSTLAFGTIEIPPGTANSSYTVTNNGEIDLTISIAGPGPMSDFTWAATAAPLALAVGATTPARNVTFTTATDGASVPQTITITPSLGAVRTITCTGAGCIPNATIQVPAITPLSYGQIERGFRTVRLIEVINGGDDDLTFTARITAGTNPAQAANFGLVLPENDITDAPSQRTYSVLPAVRCGAGPVGENAVPVAVSFFADGANGTFGANLVIEGHNATNVPAGMTWTFPLSAEIIDPIPVDIALVIDRSGSMNDPAWSRNKMEAALAGSKLLVQMLRDTAEDRCAIVGFNELPVAHQPIALAGPNRAALLGTLAPPTFAPGGNTNIVGGIIIGREQLATPHPSAPPGLKRALVVLTDGKENRCFQQGGAGPWLSITGRDAADGMARPDNITVQDTDVYLPPADPATYCIGLGQPNDIDSATLTAISATTNGSYQGAEDLTGKHYFLLEKYFTQIFMKTANLSQIADPFYTIAAGDKHPHQFSILPGDVNAMVVTYDMPGQRLPFYIESPKGEILSGTTLPAGFSVRFRSTPTARFAEFYFPNKEPDRYVGMWTVWIVHPGYTCAGEIGGKRDDGQTGDGFLPKKCRKNGNPVDYGIAIGAGSNLRMQPFVDPGVKYVGDPIRLNAVVSEAGLPVKGANVRCNVVAPNGAAYSVALLDDGLHQDGQPDDGDYGGTFMQTYMAGNYQLTFVADGYQGSRPFHREEHRTKPVYDPRRPPNDGNGDGDGRPGGGGGGEGGDCCRRLLRVLSRQEKLLEQLIKQKS